MHSNQIVNAISFLTNFNKSNLSAKEFDRQDFLKNQIYKVSSQITYKSTNKKFHVCDIFSSKPNFFVYVGFHFITMCIFVVTNKFYRVCLIVYGYLLVILMGSIIVLDFNCFIVCIH